MHKDLKRRFILSEERGCGERTGEESGGSAGNGSGAFDEAVGEAGDGGVVENIGKRVIKHRQNCPEKMDGSACFCFCLEDN